ncbi:hypothetical protein GGR57DRAFT_464788, partial [Xylariaceae sp. FL1272]
MATPIDKDDFAMMDEDTKDGMSGVRNPGTPFLNKTRSLSDGNNSQLSPSPLIVEASRRTSKDDSSLGRDRNQDVQTPVTPRRPEFPMQGLSLQMPPQGTQPAQSSPYMRPAPLSPKLDHSQIYASPTNILPRRSRGLDFSRAATSLHHSTLAEQSSPDLSPTISGTMGSRAMNIPGRGNGDFGTEQSSNSLWSVMGNQERMNISSSVGSTNPIVSDSSSSSGDEDAMDDEMEDAIYSTPQVSKSNQPNQGAPAVPWLPSGSSAINNLSSYRTRPRKRSKRRLRGLASLGFNAASPATLSRSPPGNSLKDTIDISMAHPRRESISWAANQLHISGSDIEDRAMDVEATATTPSRDGARGVVKRAVTRRGNLYPKTKGFARIRAQLLEEGAPVDTEVRREAEVIRQVRESDVDLEPRVPPARPSLPLDLSNISTAPSQSPKHPNAQVSLEDIPDDLTEFKQQAMKNSKGNKFWDTFSETGSINGTRITSPPASLMPRGSSSGMSEDVNMDSPSLSTGAGFTLSGQSDSQKADTPHRTASATPSQGLSSAPPTAAEITRRINNKRRREDDFDPHVFKRRAVSPGMSVHNSPVMQSPLQRDNMPWGSRPGSNHGGDKASGNSSENGSTGGHRGSKGRVGFQGMVDTNDSLMRMSI